MAGQVIARGDRTWLVRVFLGRGADGKRRYHNHTVHGTKKDAQAYLNAVLRDRDLGTFVEPGKDTLDEYLDRWLADAAKPRVREHAFRDYTALLARYVRPALGDRRLCDLTPLDVQGLYSAMLARGLSARTVRYTHAVLRQALGQAVKWGMLARNIATLVDLPRRCSFSLKKGPGFSPKKGPVRVSSSRARIWVFAMEGGEDEASPLPLAACQALGSLPSGALSS